MQDKKTEDLADMKRKMAELQAQVQRLEREASSGGAKGLNPSAVAFQPAMVSAPATPALHALAGLALPGPAVDPRSVHVQGVSPLAVPEVIGAHFSGCAPHRPFGCHQQSAALIWKIPIAAIQSCIATCLALPLVLPLPNPGNYCFAC